MPVFLSACGLHDLSHLLYGTGGRNAIDFTVQDDTIKYGGTLALRCSAARGIFVRETKKQLKARLDAAFHISFQALVHVGRDGRILAINTLARELVRNVYGRDVYPGEAAAGILPAEDAENFTEGFVKALRGVDSEERLFIIVKGVSGEEYWLEYQLRSVRVDGEVESVLMAIDDITRRKIAIDEVARSARRYQSLVKNSSDIIIILNREGGVRYVSDSVEQMLGYRPRELVDRNVAEWIFPQDLRAFLNALERTVTGGGTQFFTQFRFRHRNGEWVFFEAVGNNLLDDETIQGLVLNWRDVTERKHYEEMLARISRQNELILEAAGEGVYGISMDGLITFVNPAAARMMGMRVEDMIGRNHREVVRQSDENRALCPEEECLYFEAMRDGRVHTGDGVLFQREDGSLFPVQYIATPILERGRIVGAVVTFNDITERRRADEDLRRAKEEADAANRAKSDFLANMSHEIRTPINSLLGFLELLLETRLDATQREYAGIIRESGRNLLEIISDILDYSKIERGRMDIEHSAFLSRPSLEGPVELFAARASEKGIRLVSFVDPLIPRTLVGDSLRVRQVLNNLISNAIKFTPENGAVTVEIGLKEKRENGCTVSFSVGDTGIGIAPDKREIIFESFRQEDNSIARRYGGTGLGLAISSSFVRLMGGEIGLESSRGAGSRFFFDINFGTTRDDSERLSFSDRIGNARILRFGGESSPQEDILGRYLCALGIAVENTGPEDFMTAGEGAVLFADVSMQPERTVRTVIGRAGGNPLVLVVGERQRGIIETAGAPHPVMLCMPLTASKCVAAIMKALGLESPETTGLNDGGEIIFPGRALVAEDAPANQRLIRIMLERLGLTVSIARDGIEAVEMFRDGRYDIVFMDISMPVLDGIEATARILEIETKEERSHTPVIALTARAVKGERERLLASGMDDYLSKPVDMAALRRVAMRFLSGVNSGEGTRLGKDEGIVNLDETAISLGIERAELEEMLRDFLDSSGEYLSRIERSVTDGDSEDVRFAAHFLKGVSSNYGLTLLATLSGELESAAEEGRTMIFVELADSIRGELERLCALVRAR